MCHIAVVLLGILVTSIVLDGERNGMYLALFILLYITIAGPRP